MSDSGYTPTTARGLPRKNAYPKNRKSQTTPQQRFDSRYRVLDNGCWEWTASIDPNGYGRFYAEGGGVRAHRWVYERMVGPIPHGLVIDHLCRNRACVNPDHMEPVTSGENVLRGIGIAAVAAAATHCPQGHAYDAENTRITPSGFRVCRTCHRIRATATRKRDGDKYQCPHCGEFRAHIKNHIGAMHPRTFLQERRFTDV